VSALPQVRVYSRAEAASPRRRRSIFRRLLGVRLSQRDIASWSVVVLMLAGLAPKPNLSRDEPKQTPPEAQRDEPGAANDARIKAALREDIDLLLAEDGR
jgi:hypothetical protein